MEAKAIAKSVRVSPRKMRLVIDLIRGKKVGDAVAILKNTKSPCAVDILKTLTSAVANAENNYSMDVEKLFIKEIYANGAQMLKRYRARAKGSGNRILKRTSHITIVVSDGLE